MSGSETDKVVFRPYTVDGEKWWHDAAYASLQSRLSAAQGEIEALREALRAAHEFLPLLADPRAARAYKNARALLSRLKGEKL